MGRRYRRTALLLCLVAPIFLAAVDFAYEQGQRAGYAAGLSAAHRRTEREQAVEIAQCEDRLRRQRLYYKEADRRTYAVWNKNLGDLLRDMDAYEADLLTCGHSRQRRGRVRP